MDIRIKTYNDVFWGDGFLSVFKTRAVVLKTQDFKENDKLVWLFTEKLGKISAIAKNAKKGNSKLRAATLPFCYGDFVVYRGKSLYTINEISIIDSFQVFLDDIDTLTYTSYLNELIDISLPDEESNRELFRIFMTAYYLIKNDVGDLEILIRAFEIKLLEATGYGINMEYCSICRNKIQISNYIDIRYFGAVCDKCSTSTCVKISNTTYNALRFLSNLPLERFYRLILDSNSKKELYQLLSNIISQIYKRKPKSLELLLSLKE